MLYNLKRKITLTIVFVSLYLILLIDERSIINWGFLVILSMNLYVELSKNKKSIRLKKGFWNLMIIYSFLVIFSFIVFLFIQLPFINNLQLIRQFKQILPTWMLQYPQILGFKFNGDTDLYTNKFYIFFPYLMFLILSVYIESEIIKWNKDEYDFD